MARKHIPVSVETNVLVKSRRRCAICFGLKRDLELVSGQIAHLDKDNGNPEFDNLCFLCFDHHDEYDSVSSQRKSLTIREVKAFRSELYETISRTVDVPVHFGSIKLPPDDPYVGKFTRLGNGSDSAEIVLVPLPDTIDKRPRYFMSGFATGNPHPEYGPNIGELSAVLEVDEHGVLWANEYRHGDEIPHKVRLKFNQDTFEFFEENFHGLYGVGVSFIGEYQR